MEECPKTQEDITGGSGIANFTTVEFKHVAYHYAIANARRKVWGFKRGSRNWTLAPTRAAAGGAWRNYIGCQWSGTCLWLDRKHTRGEQRVVVHVKRANKTPHARHPLLTCPRDISTFCKQIVLHARRRWISIERKVIKIVYNHTIKLDRLLSNGHHLLSHSWILTM
jgi:hypothetical protein